MFISKEIHIFHSSLLDSISSNQFFKQSLHADLEYIIKIALLRLLVFHNFVLNSLLIDYHTELIKLVQRSVQFPFFVGLNRGRLYFHVPIPAMFSDTAFCCMVFSRCDVLFIFRQKHQATKRKYFIVCFI